MLWGSHFETQARQNLRQALFRLRRVLGQDVLRSDGEEVSLAPGDIACDATQLVALVGQGTRTALSEAVELYKSHLLVDIGIREQAWSEWLESERVRLEGLALDAMVKLGDLELQAGFSEKALAAANKAIAINNLREDAHRLAIRALAAAGRRADALKRYEHLVALLKSELDVEPDASTRIWYALSARPIWRHRTQWLSQMQQLAALQNFRHSPTGLRSPFCHSPI